MTTILPLHCHECPIRNHCPHNAYLASTRLDDPRFISRLSEKERTKITKDDFEKIEEAAKNCPLLKSMHFHA